MLAHCQIIPSQECAAVIESLERVRLVPFENRLTRSLSGISWGSSRCLFLDELTTRLDLEYHQRGENWMNNHIDHAFDGRGRSLCQKVSIMVQGVLRCIGPQLRLEGSMAEALN